MKRRLSSDLPPAQQPDSDVHSTVAALVAQQVAAALLSPLNSSNSSVRFGRVAFADNEQHNVNAFLHQKLGKDSLARRPGPGGRKLTYIESCKAIELANRAFGFNGWSCHIVECKEEFKEKKGDRWSIAYSSLVRIELKDGTSHEDVGFGASDGQKDLGAALEQAKKASVSDARKRALRLFGEYLGNSCYDREHIKDVHSNRPMAPLAAAPSVVLPGQPQKQPSVLERGGSVGPPAGNGQPAVHNEQAMKPPPREEHQPQDSRHQQPQAQQPLRQHVQPLPSAQHQHQHQQQHQQQHHLAPTLQSRQPMPQHRGQPQQQQQWKPPQKVHTSSTSIGCPSVEQRNKAIPAAIVRPPTMQTTSSNKTSSAYGSSSVTTSSSSSSSPLRPQVQRWVSSNAPPPPRMTMSKNPRTVFKTEQLPTAQDQQDARYNIDDLSLSQFDYDPTAENSSAKRMRS
ncbi:unnamed protein product [Hyaloperonospora brassicae]|uniref:Uncharacterized protein n=1 Tax=Hyaloperonospora brassicae TaxID=162125 RepID=A0AAV0SY78_HYABA|nr:unnamed protein product [Hyaloperonospora brassicae]